MSVIFSQILQVLMFSNRKNLLKVVKEDEIEYLYLYKYFSTYTGQIVDLTRKYENMLHFIFLSTLKCVSLKL